MDVPTVGGDQPLAGHGIKPARHHLARRADAGGKVGLGGCTVSPCASASSAAASRDSTRVKATRSSSAVMSAMRVAKARNTKPRNGADWFIRS
jgi:hypothetical protein